MTNEVELAERLSVSRHSPASFCPINVPPGSRVSDAATLAAAERLLPAAPSVSKGHSFR